MIRLDGGSLGDITSRVVKSVLLLTNAVSKFQDSEGRSYGGVCCWSNRLV